MRKVNLIHLFLFDLFLNAYLFPIRVGYATNLVDSLKPYYYKIIGYFTGSKDPQLEARRQAPLMPSSNFKKYDKDEYVPEEYIMQQNIYNNKTFDFFYQDFVPYWPEGDYVYNRTVEYRNISSTPSSGTDKYPLSTYTPVTWNPDCNQDCMRIYDDTGRICAQRWVEKRKQTATYTLFNFWGLSWLWGWWFNDNDRQDRLEFRNFESLCDLEFENCRNITHNPSWFPTHFGYCKYGFNESEVTPARLVSRKIYWANRTHTTQVWMIGQYG